MNSIDQVLPNRLVVVQLTLVNLGGLNQRQNKFRAVINRIRALPTLNISGLPNTYPTLESDDRYAPRFGIPHWYWVHTDPGSYLMTVKGNCPLSVVVTGRAEIGKSCLLPFGTSLFAHSIYELFLTNLIGNYPGIQPDITNAQRVLSLHCIEESGMTILRHLMKMSVHIGDMWGPGESAVRFDVPLYIWHLLISQQDELYPLHGKCGVNWMVLTHAVWSVSQGLFIICIKLSIS